MTSACSTPTGAWCCRRWHSGSATSILLFRNYFKQLPGELFEAALIDGCGYFRFFWYVTLPLSRPILATVAVIVFVQQLERVPAATGGVQPRHALHLAAGHHGLPGRVLPTDWNLVLAFIALTILPAVVIFFSAQKHIVAGLTSGSVKG